MDWSLLRPHARFMFLRDELLYPSNISVRCISSSALCLTDNAAIVLLSSYRDESITVRRGNATDRKRRSPTSSSASFG
jgi:hypothetical protein